MKAYRKVLDFYYKNSLCSLFIDNQNKYYFLKNNNTTYEYLDINTFIEIGNIFCNPPKVLRLNNEKRPVRFIPKILIGGIATVLTLSSCSLLVPPIIEQHDLSKKYESIVESYESNLDYYNESGIQDKLSFDVEENNDEEFIVDTFVEFLDGKTLIINDMNYLNMVLNYSQVSLEQFYNVIDNNSNIPTNFKELIKSYCKDYIEKFPNAERRVLYENLKTLEIVECENKFDLAMASLSSDSLACYVRSENRIYVMKDYKYEKNTWDYQIIYHELTHAARTAIWEKNGKTIKVNCEGANFYTLTSEECLNSIFAVDLYNPNEKDIAYQFQSNYFKIMVDNMDNYKMEDYINYPLSYFVKKLDEFNNDKNYASIMLEVLQSQYDDYHSDKIHIIQSEFYPLYDYISDMYYKNRITTSTTYDAARQITDELLEKLLYDVPEEYEVDINHFYDHLNEYCKAFGIETKTHGLK